MDDAGKIIVYGRKNSINVMKVTWCAAELAIPFERIDVGGAFGLENAPNYADLNPNLLVPTIDDKGLILWESNVIVRYLAETYGRSAMFPHKPAARWEAEKWMDWMQTALQPHLSVLLRQTVRTPSEQRDMAAVETARQKLVGCWPILEAHLAQQPYVAGDELTMGDIPLGAAVYRWYAFEIERPSFPHIEAWHKRLLARQAYQEHVNQPLS